MITWPWKRSSVTQEDIIRRHHADLVAEVQEQKTAEVHREVTEILWHNNIGDMLTKSLQPRKGRS